PRRSGAGGKQAIGIDHPEADAMALADRARGRAQVGREARLSTGAGTRQLIRGTLEHFYFR
ncbi:MAG TPA: hypothetical protein VE665_06980, partial [Hyphomicrobiaceae bacterium]|nr:hypothetical protein [Hyphomicrobiaceae bacterium]